MESILNALLFAAIAHKDQRRKANGGSPYINHLIEVSQLSSTVTEDMEVVVAAVLHDILEDTRVSEQDIENKFGVTVLSYVKSLTDDKSLTLVQRRENQLNTIASYSNQLKIIKLADHCSNIASLPESWTEERLKSYVAWSHSVATLCFSVSPDLAKEYKVRYEKALESIGG